MDKKHTNSPEPETTNRRTFSGRLAFGAMVGGLAAGYGGMGAVAARYLFPAKPADRRWMFVTELARLKVGESLLYTAPNGAPINIARKSGAGTAEDFIALSSTCPHLGCRVHWEAQKKRFFCPCHNGIFDPSGKGIGGPPGDAGQNLPRYPLQIENGLLMIKVPVGKLA
jgi:cytochrome b6-f complex iron-sulfur subunit